MSNCLVIDVVGATTRHDLQTVASLFGIPPQEAAPASRTVTEQLEDLLEAVGQGALGEGLVAEAVDLFGGGPRQRLHWVRVAKNKFALNSPKVRLIVVEDFPGVWRVIEEATGSPSQTMADGLSLTWAQGVAEDRARELGMGQLLRSDARWRTTPATEKQIATLVKMKIAFDPKTITKGLASDMITAKIAR